jgi:hypothetical protein
VAAFGIWHHKRWGVVIYLALAIITQPVLLGLGLWNWGAAVVPGIIVALLLLKFKTMAPGFPSLPFSDQA